MNVLLLVLYQFICLIHLMILIGGGVYIKVLPQTLSPDDNLANVGSTLNTLDKNYTLYYLQ